LQLGDGGDGTRCQHDAFDKVVGQLGRERFSRELAKLTPPLISLPASHQWQDKRQRPAASASG
jgi:hypothetical protein